MPAPEGPQWYNLWKEKVENAPDSFVLNQYETRNDDIRQPPKQVDEWSRSSVFAPAKFPTEALSRMDSQNPDARSTDRPDFLHEMMKGTGVPEHVTVYHHGDIPKDAKYASGSVDSSWNEDVRSGWRSKDPSVNKGRLHIYLVPHEDILSVAPMEKEVFFRRGTPIRKKK
jgi:hypothetical protein